MTRIHAAILPRKRPPVRARLGGRRQGVFMIVFASGADPESYPVWSLPYNVAKYRAPYIATRYSVS